MARIRDHKSNRYKSGDHLVLCQRTGRVVYASETMREWTGLLVHKSVYEPKHPQLMIRTHSERPPPQPLHPEPADVEAGGYYVDGDYWDAGMTGVS